MKRKLAIVICLLFLVSGLIRIGVGGMMIGQAAGWWALEGEASEALEDTQRFISEQKTNFAGFTPISYFAYILFMGLTISLGAIGQIWRKHWGLILIGIYLLSHGLLFVNFMTVNPKIALLGLASLLTIVLYWANRPPKLSDNNAMDPSGFGRRVGL
ncbi:MAG: hypothetical protein P8I27_08275 [Pirellulaceae bacterium]|nr:hypothetical protein [Pirellulaceae bacterium]